MQLVLQIDEGVVAGEVKANVAEDASYDTRPDGCGFRLDNDFLQVL